MTFNYDKEVNDLLGLAAVKGFDCFDAATLFIDELEKSSIFCQQRRTEILREFIANDLVC